MLLQNLFQFRVCRIKKNSKMDSCLCPQWNSFIYMLYFLLFLGKLHLLRHEFRQRKIILEPRQSERKILQSWCHLYCRSDHILFVNICRTVSGKRGTSVIFFKIDINLFGCSQTCYFELIQKYGGPV
jgi:hypothetical protein